MLGRSRLAQQVLTVLLVPVSLVVGYAMMEAAYRGYLYWVYVHGHRFLVITKDARSPGATGGPGSVHGVFQPDRPVTFSHFAPDGRLVQRHTVPINNLGWPSRYDYARAKAPDEFRIAVIGDSMTASVNNALPWPDVLQRHLDGDRALKGRLGVARITVLNLGVVGASLQYMADPLAVIARRFGADLVVVNVIGDDLRRRHGDGWSARNPHPVLPPEPAAATEAPLPVRGPDLKIHGVGIDLQSCERRSLDNPDCGVSSYFTVPAGATLGEADLARVKSELASRMFWTRIAFSAKPLFLLEAIGRPAVARMPAPDLLRRLLGRTDSSGARMSDVVQPPDKEAEDLVIGAGAIRAIRAMHRDLMVVHNPTFWFLTGELREAAIGPLGDALRADGLTIVDMRPYLPAAGRQDWWTWYNLPHDGHWSDAGAEVYGAAVARTVRERLVTIAEARRPSDTASADARP